MSRQKPAAMILALGALALLGTPAAAQIQVDRSVIGSGATASTDGSLLMAGTIGQPLIGPAASSTHLGGFGFWYAYPIGTTDVRPDLPATTGSTAALQLRPNTVSDRAEVHLRLPASGNVSLRLYDAIGRERMELLDGRQEGGSSVLELSVAHLESGNYTLVLVSGPTRVAVPLQVVR